VNEGESERGEALRYACREFWRDGVPLNSYSLSLIKGGDKGGVVR